MEGRPPEETDLLERARRGDEDADRLLVSRYQRIASEEETAAALGVRRGTART